MSVVGESMVGGCPVAPQFKQWTLAKVTLRLLLKALMCWSELSFSCW
jgi:hypothetical protein